MRIKGQDISKYGVVAPGIETGSVLGMRYKPKYEDLASIDRYVLTPDVVDILCQGKPGAIGEIPLTDAINEKTANSNVASNFLDGRRFDCRSVRDIDRPQAKIPKTIV